MSRTIFCVEDEPDTGALLQKTLESAGYAVVRAADGRQAVCLIETTLPPSLILLDVVVPYVNGFELLAGLRRNPDWQHVPIIMVSADHYQPDIERALAEGANAYVVKTSGFHDLLETVNRLLPSPSLNTATAPTPELAYVGAEPPAARRRRLTKQSPSPQRKKTKKAS